MKISRKVVAALAAVGMTAAPALALAAPQDVAMNKEGYWAIDVDDGACAASMKVEGGSIFLIRAENGGVTFAVFFDKPIREGRKGQVQTEAYAFDFEPSFTDRGTTLYYDGDLDSRGIAALRLAKEVRVLVDGRLVHAVTFEGTGFSDALDGAIACSKGESGWWGKGVAAADPPQGAAGGRPPLAFNAEGAWGLEATDRPGLCTAYSPASDHLSVMLFGAIGVVGLAINSDDDLPQGRNGLVEADGFRFAFQPRYDGKRYFAADPPFESQSVFVLRRARSLKVSVNGRKVVEMDLRDTGFSGLLDSLIACSKGENGWWGEGAKQP